MNLRIKHWLNSPRMRARVTIISVIVTITFLALYHNGLLTYKAIPNSRSASASINVINKQPIGNQEQSQASRLSSIVGNANVGISKALPSHDFWNRIFTIFEENKFQIEESQSNPIGYTGTKYEGLGVSTSKDSLMDKAVFTQATHDEIRMRHASVLGLLPDFLDQSTYKKKTRGIVLIGGGWFSWLSYLSLIALRDTGSKLPVEFIIPSFKDYEKEYEFCNHVLPKLDASCVVVADKLGTAVTRNWEFGSYQFKALAIVTSTFQHVILLDSDNVLVQNPDQIFDSKVYRKHGLITWPDYWKRTISPYFYSVAAVKVDEETRVRYDRFPLMSPVRINSSELLEVPYHDLDGAVPDLSTESGQLIVDKKIHGKTLLVALYYNIFGPGYYYKLFSLGQLGEGDKDTFVTAAVVLKKPNYQVKSLIHTVGYHDTSYHGLGMGQKDPILDYQVFTAEMKQLQREHSKKNLPMNEQVKILKEVEDRVFSTKNDIPLFAVHCNILKINPVEYMKDKDLYDKKEDRLKVRMYNGLSYANATDKKIDFEWKRWTFVKRTLCEERLMFDTFEGANITEVCNFVNNTVRWLTPSTQLKSEN